MNQRYNYKEPLIHFKKESTLLMTIITIAIGLGIMSMIGLSIIGSAYDAKHPNIKTENKTDSPYTPLLYMIAPIIIIISKIGRKKKPKRFYNSEGELVE